ncbi:MAG: LacI family DNA-binding transcriptional regulator [Terriglobia bacterium]
MRGQPVLRQLAETVGVSLTTVSRIVNGSARVGAELHDRVREAALKIPVKMTEGHGFNRAVTEPSTGISPAAATGGVAHRRSGRGSRARS